jgi:hypothetical protein
VDGAPCTGIETIIDNRSAWVVVDGELADLRAARGHGPELSVSFAVEALGNTAGSVFAFMFDSHCEETSAGRAGMASSCFPAFMKSFRVAHGYGPTRTRCSRRTRSDHRYGVPTTVNGRSVA